ncbi:MAG: tRNA 2-thiouridine(34) synthase MnmA [Chloroflexi bacterium RBG_16_50_11]|nr:MAG: tRNA 2-thiouridine(34) synthase MnmA [Chloroflexi bacterium RBG_16_50_11]
MKAAVAMSGGVDSSLTAALLKQEGHDVFGVTMRLTDSVNSRNAVEDASKVAAKLGIPHYAIELRDIFSYTIIDDFCREYRLGHTPNPCVLCNRQIKFGALWEKAGELGADFLATGHYARIERDKSSKYLLKKGADRRKDQSYFLYRLTQEQLSHTLFPLGNLTKAKVRQIAKEIGLPVAERPESQEICFIPDNDYAGFLKDNLPGQIGSGPIIDQQGKVLGQHDSIAFYTVGQRKGLGIAAARPLYVTAIEPVKNAVVVGTKEQTYTDELITDNLNWIAGSPPVIPINIKARIRYRHPEAEAIVSPLDNNSVHVKFAEPQMAVTPGQSVVFYDDDAVIGGGRIIRQGR